MTQSKNILIFLATKPYENEKPLMSSNCTDIGYSMFSLYANTYMMPGVGKLWHPFFFHRKIHTSENVRIQMFYLSFCWVRRRKALPSLTFNVLFSLFVNFSHISIRHICALREWNVRMQNNNNTFFPFCRSISIDSFISFGLFHFSALNQFWMEIFFSLLPCSSFSLRSFSIVWMYTT